MADRVRLWKGDRVRFSNLARTNMRLSDKQWARRGTVATNPRDSQFVRVKWDGMLSVYTYAAAFIILDASNPPASS